MNRFFYTLLLYSATPFIGIYLIFKLLRSKDDPSRLKERFGFSSLSITQPTLLIHCASVGETKAALPLIQRLQATHPDFTVLVTTNTPTSRQVLFDAFGTSVTHCYLPFDYPGAVKRFLKPLDIRLCIIIERELWPNLLHQLNKKGSYNILANARMTEKSAKHYLRYAKPLIKHTLNQFDQVYSQSQSDNRFFLQCGLSTHKLLSSGNIKYDIQITKNILCQQHTFKQQWALNNRLIWIAGSTHPGEHETILNIHQDLIKYYPNLLLIIAPRHPERVKSVVKYTKEMGFDFIRRSDQKNVTQQTQVLIADTLGELIALYGLADIAFVGGSLINRGGHNPLEPASMGIPVIMGPHTEHCKGSVEGLIAANALILSQDQESLKKTLLILLGNKEKRQTMSKNAQQFIKQHQGTTDKILVQIEKILPAKTSV